VPVKIDVRRAQPRRRGVLTAVLVALAASFAVFAALASSPPHDVDADLSRAAHDFTWDSDPTWRTCRFLAELFANYLVLGFLAVLATAALWLRRYRIAGWLVASGVVAVYGNKLIKSQFHRFRPHWNPPLDPISGYAFPSGHATAAAMVATVLILLTIAMTDRGWLRRGLIALWVALAVAVAVSRVMLGVHYPTDVLGGLCFGSFVALALWLVVAADPRGAPQPLQVTTGSGTRQAAVILNPSKVGDVDAFQARVRSVADAAGWGEPLWFETSIEDPGLGQAHSALQAGADLLLAVGGDGTVRAVCDEAARTGVAVAIIPHGTGNLLARNLGIPLNSRSALEVAFEGQDRAIDLATFETDTGVDSTFLVMAGLGFDAAVMSGVDDGLKERVGWWAYVVSGIKALRFPTMRVTITVDDEAPVGLRARTVVVGNVGFLQGGLPLLPEAEIDDGLLNVVVLSPRRAVGWLMIAWKIVTRRPGRPAQITRFTGQRIIIESSAPAPMQLDGDPVGEATTLTAEVHPGVLLVRVPTQ
jgi:diacylglycerol kinase family enzyme/membrane-associated phospholipid phosphatase